MNSRQKVSIEFDIPADWDAEEFAFGVLTDWNEANDESFPEMLNEVKWVINNTKEETK